MATNRNCTKVRRVPLAGSILVNELRFVSSQNAMGGQEDTGDELT